MQSWTPLATSWPWPYLDPVPELDFNDGKPLKPMVAWHQNHRKTIEPNGFTLTIPFNGDGAFENHWNLAMVAKCGAKSVDFVVSLQNGPGTLKWSEDFIHTLSLFIKCVCPKMGSLAILSFLGLLNRPKPSLTIVPEFVENHWKTIDVNGQSVKKHSMVMV